MLNLFFIILFSSIVVSENSGTCNNAGTCKWTFYEEEGKLSITGTGYMADWSSFSNTPPWNPLKNSIKTVEIEGVESIGENAFSSCEGLTTVTLGSGLKAIGKFAFSNCENLTTVTLGSGLKSIGNYAFNYCLSLTSITIPDTVETIGSYAFDLCRELTTVTFGSGLKSIGLDAFSGCPSLSSIDVSAKNSEYCSLSGVLFTKNMGQIIKYPASKPETEYTIPNSVESIEKGAFELCKNLISVIIPESVKIIGTEAFYLCVALTSITIPDTVEEIGYFAFKECSSLTTVVFEGGELDISFDVFQDCFQLKNIFYDATEAPSYCSSDVFGESGVSEVVVPTEYEGTDFCGMNIKKSEKKTCGQFTTQIEDSKEHVGCLCVDSATYVEGNYHACECDDSYHGVGNECHKIIECGEFTTEYQNATNTEPCVCVDDATFVDANNNKCKCDNGYHSIGNECHKIIECGPFTTEYKNTTNTEPCQCVDDAIIDTSLGNDSNTCKCEPKFEGNTEKTVCSPKSDDNNEKDNGSNMITMLLVLLLVILL